MNSDSSLSGALPLASIKHRIYAGLIDYGLFIGVWVSYILTFGEPDPEGGYRVQGLRAVPLFLLWFVYFPGMEGWLGRTFGKEIVGLQVVQASGQGISALNAVKRRILDVIDFSFFAISGLVAASNTEGKQRLGDLWASTHVIRTPTVRCPHCGDKVILARSEIRTGRFQCPSCQEQAVVPIET